MKPFSLEEYLKNPKRKIVTRDGRNVRIICTDHDNISYPIVGAIKGYDFPFCFSEDGYVVGSKYNDANDLFFATKVGWVNLYRGRNGKAKCAHIYDTEEEALENRGVRAISTVKIEWED